MDPVRGGRHLGVPCRAPRNARLSRLTKSHERERRAGIVVFYDRGRGPVELGMEVEQSRMAHAAWVHGTGNRIPQECYSYVQLYH